VDSPFFGSPFSDSLNSFFWNACIFK
jgi:hypothetical protein